VEQFALVVHSAVSPPQQMSSRTKSATTCKRRALDEE
jgi:hypothetical protein